MPIHGKKILSKDSKKTDEKNHLSFRLVNNSEDASDAMEDNIN